jgi:hypothetical protein
MEFINGLLAHSARSLAFGSIGRLCPQLAALVLEPFALLALGTLFFYPRPIEIGHQDERQESEGFDGEELGQANWNI